MSDMMLVPGTHLDRFELVAQVAQGGMASVWLARLSGKHGVAKLFAIKTILPQYANDPQFHVMFVDEARIASRIEHPNVAQIFELGEHGGVLYIVMEWVDGDSLDAVMSALDPAEPAVPVGVAVRIAADACAGLHAAHELRGRKGEPLGVVHRDVSPQNLLVTPLGVTKVIDFGVAKARDRLAGQTTAGSTRGKICYMPREQALGLPIDRRVDVWALGAVLHFLLAARHPFEGSSPLDTFHRVMNGVAPHPLPPSVPAPIGAIVRRALAHDEAERFETMAAMRDALLAAAQELGLDTRQEAVAAFLDRPLADRRVARAALFERGIEEAEARLGLAPTAARTPISRTATTEAGPAPAVPAEPAATLGSTTIEQGTRRVPRRVAVGTAGAALVVVALAGAVLLARRGPAASHAEASSGATSPVHAPSTAGPAPEDRPPAVASTPPPVPGVAADAGAASPLTSSRPDATQHRPAPRPTVAASPSSTPSPSASAASSSTRRDYGF